jgi:2-keto-4-pentenoate hydratase/2-oxohepta-3-ene-1,7-dioic acid hydratase in catechol pathway
VRIARVLHNAKIYLARIEGDHAVLLSEESGHPSADALREALAAGADLNVEGVSVELGALQLLSPVAHPGKFLAIGQNYLDHAHESGAEAPIAPIAFIKAATSIIGPNDVISYRKDQSTQVDYEVELALVIGRRARDVSEAAAAACIFGYTVCNDVSARDVQFSDGQWSRGKSFDTFAPLGPWIVTGESVPNPQGLAIRAWVNGELLQDGNTADMIFTVAELVSYLSHSMTLEPGDVITTGTPEGVGFARTPPIFLEDGDVVEVEVEGIGRLRNSVRVDPDLARGAEVRNIQIDRMEGE